MNSYIEDQHILQHTVRIVKFERPLYCFRSIHTSTTLNLRNIEYTMQEKIIGNLSGILVIKFRCQRAKIYGNKANRFEVTEKQRYYKKFDLENECHLRSV